MSASLLEGARRRGVFIPPEPHTTAVLGELAASLFLHPMRTGRRAAREERYLETARRLTVPTSAGGLAVWEWGKADTPLVFLVHGWEGHGAQLGAFAAPLVAAGFRVQTFDAPGHGESPGDESSVPQIARLLVELAARAGGELRALLGHSMGAAAAAMATQYGLTPRGLVLLAPPLSQMERTLRVAQRMELAPEISAEFFAAIERRTGVRPEEANLLNLARRAPCPMLALHDPADTDTSFAETESVVAAWREGRLVPCPGRGHYRIMSTPEVVRQAVAFIAALR